MTRGGRIAAGVGALLALQGLIVAIYLAKRAHSTTSSPRTFSFEVLASHAPDLRFAHSDGTSATLDDARGKPVLVHFWATWCQPCRTELPSLLAYTNELAKSRPFQFIAVAVDDDWNDIITFFDGNVPPSIVRPQDASVHLRFGASTLPDTYLVDSQGKLVERYHGARDWEDSQARAHLADVIAHAERR
jgi:thiol-disulfide isomerase/thioredoxin